MDEDVILYVCLMGDLLGATCVSICMIRISWEFNTSRANKWCSKPVSHYKVATKAWF